MQDRWPERIDVGEIVRSHNEEEHRARYVWASPLVTGRVLDIACGTGHGSALLGMDCQVVGVDRDLAAVTAARARAPRGDFHVSTVPPIPFADDRFDAAVSFETLEHIEDDRGFVAELRRVVRSGGVMLISSPNRAATSPNTAQPPNPFHVREYLLSDIVELVRDSGFPQIEVWYQRRERQWVAEHLAAAVIARLPQLCRTGRWWDRLGHGTGEVERWAPEIRLPSLWVLRCQ